MSYCAHIKTSHKIDPQTLFLKLEGDGEKIEIVSRRFPTLRFGTFKQALRGIEINEDEEGYEIRSFLLSSMADYQLFPKVVCAMQMLTQSCVYGEDDEQILDPKRSFGLKWRRQQEMYSWEMICTTIKCSKNPVCLFGLKHTFRLTKEVFDYYSIDLNNPLGGEQYKFLMYTLVRLQWDEEYGTKRAKTYFSSAPETEEGHVEVAVVSLLNDEVEPFDYIPHTKYVNFSNKDEQDWAQVDFEDLRYILPPSLFYLDDDNNFVCKDTITKEDFLEMFNAAKKYDVFDAYIKSLPEPNVFKRLKRKLHWFFFYLKQDIKKMCNQCLIIINKRTNKIKKGDAIRHKTIRFRRKNDYNALPHPTY